MKTWRLLAAVMTVAASTAMAVEPGTEHPARSAAANMQTDAPTIGQLMQGNGGSLFRASLQVDPDASRVRLSTASFYSVPAPEAKQLKKHDLITIIIREESEITSDGKTDLKKSADFDAKLEEFIKLSPSNFAIYGGAQGPTPPSIKFNMDRNFKGEGKFDRSDKFTTRIAAEVVDVKPNGTVVVQATKQIRHDDEEQQYVLTGVCRGMDVTPDNSIYSWQIHNLSVTTLHNGSVYDTQQRGFIPKVIDAVNPF